MLFISEPEAGLTEEGEKDGRVQRVFGKKR